MLKKSSGKHSETQCRHEIQLVYNLDNSFDMANQDTLQLITTQENQDFLITHYEPGHHGCRTGINNILIQKEGLLKDKKHLLTGWNTLDQTRRLLKL